jgi:poly(A) polymerase
MIYKAKTILKTLNDFGHEAFLVGGCVRDLILNREPKDYDIVTNAIPDEIKAIFPNHYLIGESFGIVKVLIDNDIFDVATYRSEKDYSDGRRPDEVKFVKIAKEDVIRRDFTMNGLLMSANGDIIDYVNGQQDIKDRLINCIGNPQERFMEDYLRILRTIRFSCQLDFGIDQDTFFAAKLHVGGLEKISQERITEEFKKILESNYPAAGLSNLKYINALQFIIPELLDLINCDQPPKHHKWDVYTHTLKMLESGQKPFSFTLAMAILLHDIAKPRCKGITYGEITFHNHENVGAEMADEICRGMKLSNDEREIIVSHVKNHMTLFQAHKMNKSTLKRLCRLSDFEDLLELHRLDCLCARDNMETYDFISKFYAENKEVIRLPRLITGDDLIALGFTPGPNFKILLTEVENLQLGGEILTKEQALEFVKTMQPN